MKKRRKRNHNNWPGKTSGNLNKEVLQVNTYMYGLECLKPIYFSIEINTQGSAFSKSKNVGILLLLF